MIFAQFGLFSFLPSVTATLVSKHFASGDVEGTQDTICQSLLFSVLVSSVVAVLLLFYPSRILGSVLKGESRENI
jgi:Na+-driven multidrug efflux pump